MLRIATAVLGAIAFSAALAADPIADHFTTEVLASATARQHLQLPDNAKATDITKVSLSKADLNGDGESDYIFTAFANNSAVVSSWLAKKGGTYKTATFTGLTPVDCDSCPRIRSLDVTGDGNSEIHIEAVRSFSTGETSRVLKFVKAQNGQLATIFCAVLDDAVKSETVFNRSTHMVKVVDVDADGVNEIQMASRRIDLLETKRGNRELARSVQNATYIYKLDAGTYKLDEQTVQNPSVEDNLAVAEQLMAAGEWKRAERFAEAVVANSEAGEASISAATRMIEQAQVAAGGGESTVAVSTKANQG